MRTSIFYQLNTIVLLLIMLCASALAAPPRLVAGEESTFAIPRMTSPPHIDGTIDPLEWREAVAVSGAVDISTDELDPRPATFFLGWDPQHLYLACRVYLPAGYKPRNSGGRVPNGADCFDDGLECLFKPLGKNVSSQNQRTEFKLNLNSLGYSGTYTRMVVGQIMSNWEPNMRAAVRTTAPGTAPNGGCWWELESAFSQADFELTGDNQAGDQWRLMLGINHLPAPWMQERIPCIGGYFTSEGKSLATLVENTPAVQMTMETLPNLASDGTAVVSLKAYNPANAATQVTVNIDVAGKIVQHETLELPAGGEKTFNINEKLPAGIKEGRVTIRALYGQTTLLSYTANFAVGSFNSRLQPVPNPNPQEFDFSVKFNPLRGLLWLAGDSYFLPTPESVKALRYEVKNTDTGAMLAAGEISKARAWRYEDVLTLKQVEPGSYAATARFILKDGTIFGPRSGTFTKKDEPKSFPAWWSKDPGKAERVLPPFTAIRRQGDALCCWGREYRLTGLGLPAAITSQGGTVLAAPARIVVTAGGKETVIPLGKPTITEAKGWRVRFTGTAEGAGLLFTARGWMEQDGMVGVELTYAPKSGKPVTVEGLRIEYPVANEVAECLASVGPGNNFAAMTATVLPTGKPGRLWTTFDTGRKGAHMTLGSFYPHVWLGSERRGFQWWADSDQGWFPDDDVPAHEVAREGNAVVLKNNIIGKPVRLTAAHTLSFTWIASPFKPLPAGWRMMAATEDGTFFEPHRGVRVNPKTGKKYWNSAWGNINWINPESEDPAEWAALWADQKKEAVASVRARRPFELYNSRNGVSWQHMSFQLIGYGPKSIEKDIYAYFGDEWFPEGSDTWNGSYTDYAMYLLDRAYNEGGVVSTYWDLSFPTLFRSPLSGLAYQLPDGRWQPGYNTLNCRRFFQRLWAVQDVHGLNPGCTGTHSTQAYIFPALPWLDAVLDGERDWNLDASDKDWIDYYPKERMRTLSEPHNWGVGICWMSNFSSVDPAKILAAKTSQAEYVWMHDSWINPYLSPGPTQMPQSILDWGLNGEDVVYHPYWRNPYVSCQDPDILISLWQLPDRVLIGIFNYDRKQRKNASLTIDLARLKLTPTLPWQQFLGVRDLYQREGDPASVFDYYARTLTVKDIKPHSARFIGIRKYGSRVEGNALSTFAVMAKVDKCDSTPSPISGA